MSEQYYENQEMIIDVQDEDVDVVDTTLTEETGFNRALVWGVGLATTAVLGGIGLWKNRDKIKQARVDRQIKKLEKKGYCVSKQIPAIGVVPDEVAVDEEQETDEE